jgi:glycosyltransferase involved in cell wall biosynthesis
MKICHIIIGHKSNDVRVFHKECTSLAKAGYEVYLVAQGESTCKNGVNIIGTGDYKSSRFFKFLITPSKILKIALKIDADIYHLHEPVLLRFVKKFKQKGKIVIFDSHENTLEFISDKEWLTKYSRGVLQFFYNRYAINRMKVCDALITVTPHIFNTIKRFHDNVVLVTNFPKLAVSTESRERYEFKEREVIFTGGISSQWSHEYIIKAMKNIKDLTYSVYGKGESSYLNYLKSICPKVKVVFHGNVEHDIVLEAQKKASIGVAIAQYSKNLGGVIGTLGNTKLFEYMLSGLPVICTDFDLWKEIISRYNCGICVSPVDVNAITKAMKFLLDNPEKAKTMGENGQRAVLEEFNWTIEENKLIGLYQRLIENNKNQRLNNCN